MSSTISELLKLSRKEPIAQLLKLTVVTLSPGYARVTMTVGPEHQNFNGMVFGGIIMALADQAFAYASNSVIRPNIAAQFNINFLSAPKIGDNLTAEGRVIRQGKRAGVTEISVTNQSGTLIARATGTTVTINQEPDGRRSEAKPKVRRRASRNTPSNIAEE